MENQQWYLSDENLEEQGPFSEHQVQEAFYSGRISKKSLLWCALLADWTELEEIQPLFRRISVKKPSRTTPLAGGAWVWVPSEQDAYLPGQVLVELSNGMKEVVLQSGEVVRISKKHAHRLMMLDPRVLNRKYDDLVLLDDVNRPYILHNLRKRFQAQQIYTSIGTILVSINPYQQLQLYTPSKMYEYRNRGSQELPPHVFGIADTAYQNMVDYNLAQSIIISGESGSGKTEATKQCLQYLAECAGSPSNVEQKILSANPILEAFGNAKTVRNNNSSRFGKFIEVFFDSQLQICGAQNTVYLLEKVRVCKQAKNERNYHVFFQLCRGCSSDQQDKLGLRDPDCFFYLNQVHNSYLEGVDDEKNFVELRKSLSNLEFSDADVDQIFKVVSAVLHLGNVSFTTTGDRSCTVQDHSALNWVSRLLGIPEDALLRSLTTKSFTIRGKESTLIPMSSAESVDARDSLAKYLYDKLFAWLIRRINAAVSVSEHRASSIGVLDIYGFEIFELNSFEQICINYANEKLQQHFNAHTFKLEEELYKCEGVSFDSIPYIDNQPVLDLLDKKPHGLFLILDEVQRYPSATDDTLIQKMHTLHSDSAEYESVLRNPRLFAVHHYAGKVEYDITGFLAKNRDVLSEDLAQLARTHCSFMFPTPTEDSAPDSGVGKSLISQMAEQLETLMVRLNKTCPHYIRCIKPNEKKSPSEFEGTLVLNQLTNSGVFEAVKIRKAGYPFRLSFSQFFKRYSLLLPAFSGDPQQSIRSVADTVGLHPDALQLGKTRVLFRAEHHRQLELKRNIALDGKATIIQKYWRGALVRKACSRWKTQALLLKDLVRSRDLEKLEEFVQSSSKLRVPFRALHEAKALVETLRKEREVETILRKLCSKDPEKNFEEFCKLVTLADQLDLQSDCACKVREKLKFARSKRSCIKSLNAGLDKVDKGLLLEGLSIADSLEFNDALVSKARSLLGRIEKEESLISLLEFVTSHGGCTAPGDSIEYDALFQAVTKVGDFGMLTKQGKKLHRLAEVLLSIRQFLALAVGTKDKTLWGPIEALVISTEPGFKDHPEIVFAKKGLANIAAKEEVQDKLAKGIRGRLYDELVFALQASEELGMTVEEFPLLADAQEWVESLEYCKKCIHDAVQNMVEDELAYALEYASSLQFSGSDVKECQRLYDRLRAINASAQEALESLEPSLMATVLEQAEELGLVTDDISEISRLLYEVTEEQFISLQLEVALNKKDMKRIVHLKTRTSDILFSRIGDLYAFHKFPRLHTPTEFAQAKFYGLAFKKEKIASSFFVHTFTPIHVPLIRDLEPLTSKEAKKMFRTILCFMGDRQNTSDPFLLAVEILTKGLYMPALRSEIYCQLVKQLTANPSASSSDRGWQLLFLCLDSFCPGYVLERYLEWWLRQSTHPWRDRLVQLYHQTQFLGDRSGIPSKTEMETILNGYSSRNWMDWEVRESSPAGPPSEQSEDDNDTVEGMDETAMVLLDDQDITYDDGDDMMLREMWKEVVDPESGEKYYYNIHTGKAEWERPSEF